MAIALLATGVAAVGQIVGTTAAASRSARRVSYAAILAEQKIEQLRGLTWGFDAFGFSTSDVTSDTTRPVESPDGGTGLSPSPPGTLTGNVTGYVDYIDQFGRVLGGGDRPPPLTVYVRRWAIDPLPANPLDSLVLQVVVMESASVRADGRLPADAAHLVTIKTRVPE